MRPASRWPERDRLTRFVRAADSFTDTLGTWTGCALDVRIVHRDEGPIPDPAAADAFGPHDLHDLLDLHAGARVQTRDVRMSCAGLVVADARSWVAVDSPALTPAVRQGLRSGGSLGDVLRPLRRRRTTVRITVLAAEPGPAADTPVLAVQARLDVAGTPVAWCEETVYQAVFGGDGARRAGLARARHRLAGLARSAVAA